MTDTFTLICDRSCLMHGLKSWLFSLNNTSLFLTSIILFGYEDNYWTFSWVLLLASPFLLALEFLIHSYLISSKNLFCVSLPGYFFFRKNWSWVLGFSTSMQRSLALMFFKSNKRSCPSHYFFSSAWPKLWSY